MGQGTLCWAQVAQERHDTHSHSLYAPVGLGQKDCKDHADDDKGHRKSPPLLSNILAVFRCVFTGGQPPITSGRHGPRSMTIIFNPFRYFPLSGLSDAISRILARNSPVRAKSVAVPSPDWSSLSRPAHSGRAIFQFERFGSAAQQGAEQRRHLSAKQAAV